jgi:hypothetical protein
MGANIWFTESDINTCNWAENLFEVQAWRLIGKWLIGRQRYTLKHLWLEMVGKSVQPIVHIISDSRFNEYMPSRPLIGFGIFSFFEENRFLNR